MTDAVVPTSLPSCVWVRPALVRKPKIFRATSSFALASSKPFSRSGLPSYNRRWRISTASVVVSGFLVIPCSPLGDASPDSLQTASCAQGRDRFPSAERRALSQFRGTQSPPQHRGRNRESGNGCPAGSHGVRRRHHAADPLPAAAVRDPVRGATPPHQALVLRLYRQLLDPRSEEHTSELQSL